MKFAAKRIAENLLFAADIFILFLVLFESKMSIPAWLQSVGRMHPMFVHFPIVILLLAMGMEFFRFKISINNLSTRILQPHYYLPVLCLPRLRSFWVCCYPMKVLTQEAR